MFGEFARFLQERILFVGGVTISEQQQIDFGCRVAIIFDRDHVLRIGG